MIEIGDVKAIKLPKELEPYIGDYYKALIKRADSELLGESEFKCFARFLNMYKSGKYKFAFKGMDRLFTFLNLLIYIDEDGKPKRLALYPVQKFMLCGIFGLRDSEGRYIVNTANLYMARRNGKSFLLSSILHYLMCMSKFRNELIILASCKGQNATICLNEMLKFIDVDTKLKEVYSSVNRTAGTLKSKLTGNRLEMFRTGAGAKKSLDGFTNKIAVIDEEMLCDEIITKTIQDGQAHFKDSLLVSMSTAQFNIGSDNHKKWISLRQQLYSDTLPSNVFLFLCEADADDIASKDYGNIKVWGKANPVLLFEDDGFTIKEHIKKKYMQKARESIAQKGFALQNFLTKQANIFYSAEDRSLCTYEQMVDCRSEYTFDDVINLGYTDWYLGVDLSQSLDLSSVAWCCYVGVTNNEIVPNGEFAEKHKLYFHIESWLPKNKLATHIDKDKFCYTHYVDTELHLCDGGNGDTIDTNQIYEYIHDVMESKGLHYVTITVDPYNIAGIQDKLADICDDYIEQNQSPKSLSQYIEALSKVFKDGDVVYKGEGEDIFEKAVSNSVMVRNASGYYSIEKISMRADDNIRIDPLDALLDGFIACYLDYSKENANGDELMDEWKGLFK